jgi:hypothetical protein
MGSALAFPVEVEAAGAPIPSRKPLEARMEASVRPGTERSIALTEFWVPIAQNPRDGSVLYGDLRMMGDDQDNSEFNVGAGYRKMVTTALMGEGIVGGHVWYDRRLTERGSKFNQLTAGMEWFSDVWDAKINAYLPLNKDKHFTQANPNGTNARFSNNQIILNTDQSVVEEALPGLDLELGLNLSFMDDVTDSTRVYGGVYHFQGDKAENVTGWRARIASDVTSDFQVGARFQRDDVRGSQGFLEATLRFPFGNKKSYQQDGIYARLDESPERDIDIVSSEAVIDDGLNKILQNNTTGAIQNIIHVDNTAPGGGTGTNESRFNTLAAAQAAAGPNDIIYVHRGNGTTAGQNAGITLNKTGQMLIGSGTDLTFDTARFNTGIIGISGSSILIAKNSAPSIGNAGGQGITISADNILVSGVDINGTTGRGIQIDDSNNVTLKNISISNAVTNSLYGLFDNNLSFQLTMDGITATTPITGDHISINTANNTSLSFTANNLTIRNATQSGVAAVSSSNSYMQPTIQNSLITDSGLNGINLVANNNSTMFASTLNNQILRSVNSSIRYGAQLSGRLSGNIKNNYSDTVTTSHGIIVRAANDAIIDNLLVENNTSINAALFGIVVDDCCTMGGTSQITNITLKNNIARNNGQEGISILKFSTSGNLGTITLDGNILENNLRDGISISAINNQGGIIALLKNNVLRNNGRYGISINDDTTSTFNIDMGGGTLNSVGNNTLLWFTTTDIFLDLDDGILKAENNWWGNASGLLAGRQTLDGASSIDSTPFLRSAP